MKRLIRRSGLVVGTGIAVLATTSVFVFALPGATNASTETKFAARALHRAVMQWSNDPKASSTARHANGATDKWAGLVKAADLRTRHEEPKGGRLSPGVSDAQETEMRWRAIAYRPKLETIQAPLDRETRSVQTQPGSQATCPLPDEKKARTARLNQAAHLAASIVSQLRWTRRDIRPHVMSLARKWGR